MSENLKKSTHFNIGCTSWAGVLLSIAIIATRAFQNGAQPIESWSAFSWFLMLLPVVFPLVLWIAFIFLGLVSAVACALCDK